ncbi:electron transfer flavoprotein subunit beta/FixA family protein [Rhizobium leguminosarum]|uniref:electron transfer flavoprotein subunit beta/FixA family protein n=1 Tax=Rhizobium leguminosarum TaxID=384 RepID=UPI001C912F04|nr:electron transfer flavoprotein subunit beta/FixA family protein [Rhizobium leguminosarum]MBY2996819.1 electron transfer flavoprotein subunit beta/FixA family protein [Rhizobium leguminosarum]MBY3061609.1 electron transfer flavoprotein subunit beta/FixA family protein [Rhizobium leguminosarum]
MKILVTVKSVVDYNVKIRVKPDGSGVDLAGVKHSMNPFDEISVEEAIRLREAGAATEIVVVSIGGGKSEEALRAALAMGADRAILIETTDPVEPLGVAKLVKHLADDEQPGMIIVGKQAIDDDSAQTGQMISALLNWPQATFASKIQIGAGKASVTREIDGGLQIIEVNLPAVVTTDLRLNEPRYASLPNIMKAKKKPMSRKCPSDFAIDLSPRLTVVKTEEPTPRPGGVKVASVAELISKLKNEAHVL